MMPSPSRRVRMRARIKTTKARWVGPRPGTTLTNLQSRATEIINGIIRVTLDKLYHDVSVILLLETPFGYSLAHPDMSTQTREWLINQLRKASEKLSKNSDRYKYTIIFDDTNENPTLRVICDHCDTEVHSGIMINIDSDWPTELKKMKADIPNTNPDFGIWMDKGQKPKSEANFQDISPKGPISGSLDSIRKLLRGGENP